MGHLLGYASVSTSDQATQFQLDALAKAGWLGPQLGWSPFLSQDTPILNS